MALRSTSISFVGLMLLATFLSGIAAYAQNLKLKNDEELNVWQVADTRKSELRITNNSFYAHLPDNHVDIIAQAPMWAVQAISRERKLYCETPLKEWLRRGSPLNFLNTTTIADWPLVPLGKKPFLNMTTTAFAMPYQSKDRIVPISKGYTGELLALTGVPQPVSQILHVLYQTPMTNGLPLQMRIWDAEDKTKSLNTVFIFSGGKKGRTLIVRTTQLSITKKHKLLSVIGLKACKDPRDVWVSDVDTEQFQQLMH